MATQFIEFNYIDYNVWYITETGEVRRYRVPLSILDNNPMIEILQNAPFRERALLVSQADGHTAITGVASGAMTFEYQKESSDAWITTTAISKFKEAGGGLYHIDFPASFTDELGSFLVRVSDPNVTGWMPFTGESKVVAAFPGQIHAGVTTTTGQNVQILAGTAQVSGQNVQILAGTAQVSGQNALIDDKVDYVSGQVQTRTHTDIFNAVTGQVATADLPAVQVGASYDGTTYGISLGLEREGVAVTTPISGQYVLYNQTGTRIASGSSVSPDAQGVFRFTGTLVFGDDTIPYVHATVKDLSGPAVTTRQYLPVVG